MADSQSPSTKIARKLRRQETPTERLLWQQIRDRQLKRLKFRRQVPIEGCIDDFACFEAELIIELDGGHHSTRVTGDEARTRVLEHAGFRVLRFRNNDVSVNLDGVLATLLCEMKLHGTLARKDAPHPGLLPSGEGTLAPTVGHRVWR